MKVQADKYGGMYVYIPKADAKELGIQKGDDLRCCCVNDSLTYRKRKGDTNAG